MQSTTKTSAALLLLLTAMLFGSAVRLMPALIARFPLNDGGMFFDMTRELTANHYLLPAVTGYNGLDLPYAYPPFGFYLTSLLADTSTSLSASFGRIPLLDLFLWLPALFATLAIPAFYLLARSLLADDLRAALAALFFALTPGSYFWHLMGGGLTRSLGVLFLLLSVYFVHRLFASTTGGRWIQALFPSVLFCSLTVLSHPEYGLHVAALCALLWFFFGRTKQGTLHAVIVVAGVTMLTSPWWGTILARHGAAPFLSAAQTGLHAGGQWLNTLWGVFVTAEFIPFLFVLRMLGFVYALWKKQYLLIAFVLGPILVDPRSAKAVSLIALSMLSSLALLDALPSWWMRSQRMAVPYSFESRSGRVVLLVFSFVLLFECGLSNYSLINSTLSLSQREGMEWVSNNVPPGSQFYLLTGQASCMSDPAQEWFPALSRAKSQTTLQGLEWTLAGGFMPRCNDLIQLHSCRELACVETWSRRMNLPYDHLWVARSSLELVESIHASDGYRMVYDSESVIIFRAP